MQLLISNIDIFLLIAAEAQLFVSSWEKNMKSFLIKLIRKIYPLALQDPEGDKGIEKRGHRGYVGGMWDEIGGLQFNFLVSKGLKPENYLLDIACGSLRLGVKAIPYLEPEHYLGIEKESSLVSAGFEKELDQSLRKAKRPNIVISDSFEFKNIGQKADFAIAQSLFSHLPQNLINLCFKNLHPWLADTGTFYATYYMTERPIDNPKKPHDHAYFAYTKSEMCAFGESNGYSANYIGNWNHPRGQVIVEYRKS